MSQNKNIYRSHNSGVQTRNTSEFASTQYDTLNRSETRHKDEVGILHAGVMRISKRNQALS